MNILHLAIPCTNIEEGVIFYNHKLGCKLGRMYPDSVIIDFFGMQLVLHKTLIEMKEPSMYPRHFGIILKDIVEYNRIHSLAKKRNIPFFKEEFVRHQGLVEEHIAFFLKDPSNNLIEFKHYRDFRMI